MKDVVALLKNIKDIAAELLEIARKKDAQVATGAVSEAEATHSSGQVETAEVELIEVTCDTAPWYVKAREFFLKDEIDDREELETFMGIDPSSIPWCAYFIAAIFTAIGIAWSKSGKAVDHATCGYEIKEPIDGCIAVFDAGKIPGGHVGIVCMNGTKILGGNQSDMVRENNLAWYLANKTLVGYYVPHGYKLVA